MRAYVAQLELDKQEQQLLLEKYAQCIEKGRQNIAKVEGQQASIDKKRAILDANRQKEIDSIAGKENQIIVLRGQVEELKRKIQFSQPTDNIYSFIRGGNHIWSMSNPPNDIINFLYSKQSKLVEQILPLAKKLVYFKENKDMLKYTQAEMQLQSENQNQALNKIRKQKIYQQNFTAAIIFKNQTYEYVFEQPKQKPEVWHKKLDVEDPNYYDKLQVNMKVYQKTSFKRVRYFVCEFFNLDPKYYCLLDSQGRIFRNDDDIYEQNTFHVAEQKSIFNYFEQHGLNQEKQDKPDKVLHVELQLKVQCSHYIAINKYMRADIKTVKMKKQLVTNEKKRIQYYMSQIKGNNKNLDEDIKTEKKVNHKILLDNEDIGQELANELNQDLFDDLKLKNDMNQVKIGYNKRQAQIDYHGKMDLLKPAVADHQVQQIKQKARSLVRFVCFIVLLNIGINLGKNQKEIQRNNQTLIQKWQNAPYSHELTTIPNPTAKYTKEQHFKDIASNPDILGYLLHISHTVFTSHWLDETSNNNMKYKDKQVKAVFHTNYLVGPIRFIYKQILPIECEIKNKELFNYFKVNEKPYNCFPELLEQEKEDKNELDFLYPESFKDIPSLTVEQKQKMTIKDESSKKDSGIVIDFTDAQYTAGIKEKIFRLMERFKGYSSTDYSFLYQADMLKKSGHMVEIQRETEQIVVDGVLCLLFNQNMLTIAKRYFILEANMYNPPSDTFIAVQIVFKYLKEGAVQSTFHIQLDRVFTYWRDTDFIHLVMQLACFLYLCIVMFINFRFSVGNTLRERLTNILTAKFVFQLKMFMLLIAYYALKMSLHFFPFVKFEFKSTVFVDLQHVMLVNYIVSVMEAFICSVWLYEIYYSVQDSLVIKLTKGSYVNAQQVQYYLYIIIMIIVCCASYVMHVFFGHTLYQYHSLLYSFVTSCLSFTEKYDYIQHRDVNVYCAMLYTSYYFLFAKILFVNVQMAVNIDAFNVMHQKLEKEIMANFNVKNKDLQDYFKREDEINFILQAILDDFIYLTLFPFKLVLCYYPYKVFKKNVLTKLLKSKKEKQIQKEIQLKEEQAKNDINDQSKQIAMQKRNQSSQNEKKVAQKKKLMNQLQVKDEDDIFVDDLMKQNENNNDEDIESQSDMSQTTNGKENNQKILNQGDNLEKEMDDFLNEYEDGQDDMSEESDLSEISDNRSGTTVQSKFTNR